MSIPKSKKTSAKRRFNVMLTESQYQRLKDYAESQEKDMAEVVREFIRSLPMKKTLTIE